MITYEYHKTMPNEKPIKVRLNKKLVGEIRKVEDGFAYFPKGWKYPGDTFKTVLDVMASIECDV